MASATKLRVMISSRCESAFPSGSSRKLSAIRIGLKQQLEAVSISGKKLFEVWINEEAPPSDATWDSWDTCLRAVDECDVLVVLYNGDAGWAERGGEVGICHAEFSRGFVNAPAKVRVIRLPPVSVTTDAAGRRNQRFQDEISKQSPFWGRTVTDEVALKAQVCAAVLDATVRLARSSAREGSRGKYHSGAALEWSRLDLVSRREAMVETLEAALMDRPNSVRLGAERVSVQVDDTHVLFKLHAMPAAFSVGPAREMVGQPFLKDHLFHEELKKHPGPVHVIACHKSASDNQAAKLLGFPDATFVAAPFGVFAADAVQKVQFVFLSHCRDQTSTRHAAQRFLEWLRQSGEGAHLVERARSRARLMSALAAENVYVPGASPVGGPSARKTRKR